MPEVKGFVMMHEFTELHGRYMQCCRPVKKALSPPRYSNKIKNKIKHDDEFKSRIMFR